MASALPVMKYCIGDARQCSASSWYTQRWLAYSERHMITRKHRLASMAGHAWKLIHSILMAATDLPPEWEGQVT